MSLTVKKIADAARRAAMAGNPERVTLPAPGSMVLPTAVPVEPEYLRLPDAVRFSGLSRSTLYLLMNSGKLKSRKVSAPGGTTGIRLISKQAIRDFIESCPDTPPGDGKSSTEEITGLAEAGKAPLSAPRRNMPVDSIKPPAEPVAAASPIKRRSGRKSAAAAPEFQMPTSFGEALKLASDLALQLERANAALAAATAKP